MKVVIDARWIFTELSGIGLYTRELIRHLARIDGDNEYILLFNRQELYRRTEAECALSDASNMSVHIVEDDVFSVAGQIRMPSILRRLGADVYHSPNYMIPLRAFPRDRAGPIRCVVTIHDVIPFLFPDHAPRSKKSRLFFFYKRVMKDISRRADAVLTVSRAARADVIRHLDIPDDRQNAVHAIHNGVSSAFVPSEELLQVHPPTILYVGRFDPYKNVVALVEAFGRLRKGPVPDAHLRIVGTPDPRYPEAMGLARSLGVDHLIEWRGYVDDADLVRSYQTADVLALPSRYEGFGLPVIEAMACGTPVVCSNVSALPEVAGQAAVLVSPDDIQELTRALATVLTDPVAAGRLRKLGLLRARAFTWERTAAATLAVYKGETPEADPAR